MKKGGESQSQSSVHPMIAVPEAIRIVLKETAMCKLSQSNEESTIVLRTKDIIVQSYNNKYEIILAENVYMNEPGYPPYRASVMDGYAVHSSNRNNDDELTTFMVQQQKVFAGDYDTTTTTTTSSTSVTTEPTNNKSTSTDNNNNNNKAYYITTGAVIPTDCDCVVPIEDVTIAANDTIQIPSSKLIPRKWIREPGCDIKPKSIVLEKGTVLHPVTLGLLLQSGVSSVKVIRKQIKITVGILSTGNELLSSQTDNWFNNSKEGTIPDVNRPILLSLFSSIPNVIVKDLGMVRDDNIHDMVNVLQTKALPDCDIILTTGGISMGETDIVEHVLVEQLHGKLHFGRIHMKPGKPTTFVTINNNNDKSNTTKLVFAMPGNPVSAVVCTHLLVMPCLYMLLDHDDNNNNAHNNADIFGANIDEHVHRMVENAYAHAEVKAKLTHDIKLDPERPEYHRVVIIKNDNDIKSDIDDDNDSTVLVTSTGIQQSSRLMSLRDAQGFLALPQATNDHPIAKTGEIFPLLLLHNTTTTTTTTTNADNNDQQQQQQQQHYPRTKVCDSIHLKIQKKPTMVGIIHVGSVNVANEQLMERVTKALSGSKSGSVQVTSCRLYFDPIDRFIDSIEENNVDILVIVCSRVSGAFAQHVKLSNLLRNHFLTKIADSLAMQARRGAAAQDSKAALFEVVVGYRNLGDNDQKGSIVILLPEEGLDQGLSNVRGLLKHALHTARGQYHHHH